MVYVDAIVLVALMDIEPHSESVAGRYASTKVELVCATWGVTEFAREPSAVARH